MELATTTGANAQKELVRSFWDAAACGEVYAEGSDKREQMETQARTRYELEPFIAKFARFAEGRGKDVLEIGVGMGADHIELHFADDGSGMVAPFKAPIAFDHRIGCVDAIDDDGHARLARDHDRKAAAGQSRRRHRRQKCQCYACAHSLCPAFVLPQPNRRRGPKG